MNTVPDSLEKKGNDCSAENDKQAHREPYIPLPARLAEANSKLAYQTDNNLS